MPPLSQAVSTFGGPAALPTNGSFLEAWRSHALSLIITILAGITLFEVLTLPATAALDWLLSHGDLIGIGSLAGLIGIGGICLRLLRKDRHYAASALWLIAFAAALFAFALRDYAPGIRAVVVISGSLMMIIKGGLLLGAQHALTTACLATLCQIAGRAVLTSSSQFVWRIDWLLLFALMNAAVAVVTWQVIRQSEARMLRMGELQDEADLHRQLAMETVDIYSRLVMDFATGMRVHSQIIDGFARAASEYKGPTHAAQVNRALRSIQRSTSRCTSHAEELIKLVAMQRNDADFLDPLPDHRGWSRVDPDALRRIVTDLGRSSETPAIEITIDRRLEAVHVDIVYLRYFLTLLLWHATQQRSDGPISVRAYPLEHQRRWALEISYRSVDRESIQQILKNATLQSIAHALQAEVSYLNVAHDPTVKQYIKLPFHYR
ncbi:MAG: hypothetical protein GYB68_12225 [Chloroflexi bacterium]|nr:hypothetical protein [Chloroflexota bacterium]